MTAADLATVESVQWVLTNLKLAKIAKSLGRDGIRAVRKSRVWGCVGLFVCML